jgi:hypothetical protein
MSMTDEASSDRPSQVPTVRPPPRPKRPTIFIEAIAAESDEREHDDVLLVDTTAVELPPLQPPRFVPPIPREDPE